MDLNVTLNLLNVNTSSWADANSTGNDGLWMLLGYNAKLSPSTDVTFCFYIFQGFFNNGTIVCLDGKVPPDGSTPNIDDQQNLSFNLTLLANFSDDNQQGNFSVQFVRPFNTSDAANDTNLTLALTDFIWEWGYLNETLPANATDKGTLPVDLRTQAMINEANPTPPETTTPETPASPTETPPAPLPPSG